MKAIIAFTPPPVHVPNWLFLIITISIILASFFRGHHPTLRTFRVRVERFYPDWEIFKEIGPRKMVIRKGDEFLLIMGSPDDKLIEYPYDPSVGRIVSEPQL